MKKGYKIYAPTRRKRFAFKHKNMIWLKGDFYFNWKKALSNSETLVHFAASGVKSDYQKDIYDVNIFETIFFGIFLLTILTLLTKSS